MAAIKGRDGWQARTQFPFPEVADLRPKVIGEKGDPVLTVSTNKSSRGLTTSVSVSWINDGFETFAIYGDFMVWPINEKVRATQKTVEDQHARALAMVDSLKAKALDFYRTKKGSGL